MRWRKRSCEGEEEDKLKKDTLTGKERSTVIISMLMICPA